MSAIWLNDIRIITHAGYGKYLTSPATSNFSVENIFINRIIRSLTNWIKQQNSNVVSFIILHNVMLCVCVCVIWHICVCVCIWYMTHILLYFYFFSAHLSHYMRWLKRKNVFQFQSWKSNRKKKKKPIQPLIALLSRSAETENETEWCRSSFDAWRSRRYRTSCIAAWKTKSRAFDPCTSVLMMKVSVTCKARRKQHAANNVVL